MEHKRSLTYEELDHETGWFEDRGKRLECLDKIVLGKKTINKITEEIMGYSILEVCPDHFEGEGQADPYAFNFYCYSKNANIITIPLLKSLEEKNPGILSRASFFEGNHGDSIPLTEAINGRNYEMIDFLIDNGCDLFYRKIHRCNSYFFCNDYDEKMNNYLKNIALLKFEEKFKKMINDGCSCKKDRYYSKYCALKNLKI